MPDALYEVLHAAKQWRRDGGEASSALAIAPELLEMIDDFMLQHFLPHTVAIPVDPASRFWNPAKLLTRAVCNLVYRAILTCVSQGENVSEYLIFPQEKILAVLPTIFQRANALNKCSDWTLFHVSQPGAFLCGLF